MLPEGVNSFFIDWFSKLGPVSVALIFLAWVVSLGVARFAMFLFRLGARTALRNPWRHPSPEGDARVQQAGPGRKAREYALATTILAGMTGMLLTYAASAPGRMDAPVRKADVVFATAHATSVRPIEESVSPAPVTEILDAADSGGLGKPPSVDLLKMIDPRQDAVAGAWTFKDRKLVTPARPFDRIQIPYVPPDEYDITVVAERLGGSNSLNLGLAVGDAQFMVILDAAIKGEFLSGLDLVDGKSFYDNATKIGGALFANGKPSKVVCSVRKTRVTVSVDGKKVIDWEADYKRLSLYPSWKTQNKNLLLLGSWSSVVHIHQLELRPVSGRGKALRSEAGPARTPSR